MKKTFYTVVYDRQTDVGGACHTTDMLFNLRSQADKVVRDLDNNHKKLREKYPKLSWRIYHVEKVILQ